MLGLSCLAVIAVILLAASSVTGLASAATTVPYTDPDVAGSIGLCSPAGQITSGSVDTVPFVWRAVSTQPSSAPYNNAGRRATLVVTQPLQNIPAGDWSGETLTAASSYTNPDSPMAAATDRDLSLEDAIDSYPPTWDGFLQLRIYLSTANAAPYTSKYPALDIQVTGNTWHAVGGATVNCAAGTAESMETVLLPTTTTAPPAATAPKTTAPPAAVGAGATKSAASGSTAASGTGGQGRSGSGGSGGVTSGSAAGTSGGQKSGSGTNGKGDTSPADNVSTSSSASTTSNDGLIAGLIVAALLVLGLSGFLVARHRRRPTAPSDSNDRPEPPDPDVSPEASGPPDSAMTSSTMKGH